MISWNFMHKHQGGNHEPFSRSDVCWGNNRRSGINVGVGMALPSYFPAQN
jgi:hypothetical protein